LFGLARAQLTAADTAGAQKNAEEVLKLSAEHAGARILLAQVIWDQRQEEQALALLKAVTDDGAVKSASGVNEQVEAFALLGRIHLSRSRVSLAEKAFEKARELDPQAVQALLGSGELFYRSGRFTEAKGRFEAALSADADSVRAAVGRAKTELALGNMKEAKDQLAALRAKKPNDALVALWLGRAEDTLGNKKAAETAYLDAIKVGGSQPDAIEAYVVLANLLASVGRNDDATARLAEATKKFPDSPELNRARAEVATSAGRLDEAKAELELALAKDKDVGTRFKLGQVLRRMRRFDEANQAFDAVAAVDKDYPGLTLERGLIFEASGDSAKALTMYEEALKKAPDDIDLKLRIGSTMVVAGQVKKAVEILREVVKKRATPESLHFLGRALLLEGANLTEAQRFLEDAVGKDPNRAEYWLYAGWVANETGNPGRADDALRKSLELDKENGDAYWQRAVLHRKRGQCFDALEDVKRALEKKPSRFEAYATRAVCLSEQSRWPETIDAWNRAIAGNPSVAEWHYQLGRAMEATGNGGAAAAEFGKALALLGADGEKQTAWAAQAHRLVGESMQGSDPAKAETHLRRYLELAPVSDTYRKDVERWLEQRKPR
jgi:tetratricopeptide (TPR) repeat protein